MSHSGHTHAPGEVHNHSHGPSPQPTPQQLAQSAAYFQSQAPPPDPTLQAIIEADFKPVKNLALGPPNNSVALCTGHAQEKCSECDVDYLNLNRMSKLLTNNPTLRCPPPPNVTSQKLTQIVTQTKDEGNRLFKMGKHKDALTRYTMAASYAVQRPPWEASQFMREELSAVISNRSAAFFEAGDFIGALVDAETVISLRRNWSKGHFRKAKALLGLNKFEDAKEALRLGLQFEPGNVELNEFLADVDKASKAFAAGRASA